ncbi:hypothetical protein K7432_007146 [Basidiobolus ranarum]|uniref:non-specific serine/threonine protein kinase n=1 Tax=Basidiobolus ranarum TaxID=34480 RepID=A0ABR2W0J1_9FUNG
MMAGIPSAMPSEARVKELQTFIFDSHNKQAELSPIYLDALLDALLALYDDCNSWNGDNGNVSVFVNNYEAAVSLLRSLRPNKHDYSFLKPLARGEFGKVTLVKGKVDNSVYALKTLNKQHLLTKKKEAFFMEERDILALGCSSPWLPKLYASFQDQESLYIVMEYAAGGDLFSLVAKKEEPILNENSAKFYIAETILAIESIHAMNYAHRDIKPTNILIDNQGHIKLADFGSSIQLDSNGKIFSNVPVGTCDYISPEIIKAQEGNSSGYGPECDWWSLGIVLYEILQGDPPFFGETVTETYYKITNHQETLHFVEDIPLSEEVKDLIKRLLCDKENRLGKNDSQEIKDHPFFEGVQWDTIREQTPPFVPVLKSLDDTSNFIPPEEESPKATVPNRNNQKQFAGNHLPFIGFTYQPRVLEAITSSDVNIDNANCSTEEPPLDLISISEHESALLNLKTELVNIKDTNALLLQAKQVLETQITEMTAAKNKTQEESCQKLELLQAEHTKHLQEYQSHSEELEKIIEKLRVDLELSQKETFNTQADLREIQVELSSVASQISPLEETNTRLTSEVDSLKAHYEATLASLSVKHSDEVNDLLSQINALSQDKEQFQATNLELVNEVAIFKTKIEECQSELQQMEKLQEKLATISERIQSLELQIKVEKQKSQPTDSPETCKEVDSLKEQLGQVEQSRDHLSNQLAIERSNKDQMLSEMEKMRNQISTLEKSATADHTVEYAQLQEQVRRLTDENQQLKNSFDQSQREVEQKSESINALELKVSQLRKATN